MQPSIFNVKVPLPDRREVFLMNTLTDAQLVVSDDVAALLEGLRPAGDESGAAGPRPLSAEEREAVATLSTQGFLVEDRASDEAALEAFFDEFREDTSELRLTILTTLQCNFACDYCVQGDHGDFNKRAHRMSRETAERVAQWAEQRMDAITPERVVVTFFGGEPLLNLPVLYFLAERLHGAAQSRGMQVALNVVTNGLLLTREVVDRLKPFGLRGVKITLDGDKETHDRMRPLRGGQGTFDRIVSNIRAIAGHCRIAIGGNFDAESIEKLPALLDFLKAQDFAPAISRVAFKPIIRAPQPKPAGGESARKVIPLVPVSGDSKPLGGSCMTVAGRGGSVCDTCHFSGDALEFARDETRRRGFATADGVHMGPCELHRRHAHTLGPDGSLYACPGFAGDASQSTGHIDANAGADRARATQRFERVEAWRRCGDCAFIPVCAGGCGTASHLEQGDLGAPTCHLSSFQSALVSLAAEAAGA